MAYEIDKHRHNFAVWAAARAAQRGFSAKAETLRNAIEGCGVVEFIKSGKLYDIDVARFDTIHSQWCTSVVNFLEKARIPKVSFGRAAKLVAVYLKSVIILGGGHTTAFARVCHPPLDAMLLSNLAKSKDAILLAKLAKSDVTSKQKRAWAKVPWTQLNAEQYRALIIQLRQAVAPDEPFWKLERFWPITNDGES
jgi:hypothetical protein